MKNTFLAIDLGTGIGRAILGQLIDGILVLQEIHHFENGPVITEGQSSWNIELLFQEIKKSLSIAADRDLPIESIGITTWGCDFSLIGDNGVPIPPLVGSDEKNEAMVEAFTTRMPADKIYGQTGVQISSGNSLFQLYALKQMGFEPLKKAKHLLFMPDIFNYLLTGVIQTEFSIAATSQLYNPVKRMWDHDILRTLGVPVAIMPRIAEPGSVIGSLSNNVSYETGVARIPVVAVASHNIASAVASIPATGNNWAFIHIDSTCQMGFESPAPVITKKSQQLNFTNEGSAGHTFRVLLKFNGLAMLKECMKSWKENNYSLAEMISLGNDAKPFAAFIDTDHPSFLHTGNMPATIADYCKSTGQDAPQTHGEIIRTIFEGLAFKFRFAAGQIQALRGTKPDAIYMISDSFKSELLCQFTADCCGIPVVTSTDEATAAGNIMVQAIALGIVKNVAEIHEITGNSFPSIRYEPAETELWDEAFRRYFEIVITK
jgi:rhamnulokinase